MAQSIVTQKKKNFIAAMQTLQEALTVLEQIAADDPFFKFLRDSLIQRFEYCTDMFWKLLREYIMEVHGLEVPASPRGTFKQAYELDMFNNDQYVLLLAAIADRNLSSHAYQEDIANRIYKHVDSYYRLMLELSEKLNP